MNFLEKLDFEMNSLGINKRKLSILADVPYTTIDGFYKKGYENAKISTIRKIANALGVSLDYLIEDEPLEIKESPSLEDGDEEMLVLYHQLDTHDRGRIVERIETLLEQEKYHQEVSKNA